MVLSKKALDGPLTSPEAHVFILTGKNGSGKTRALEAISENILSTLGTSTNKIERLICMSGTILDRFPRSSLNATHYAYFGRKTNNNMFSEIAPYRRLLEFILPDRNDWEMRAVTASKALSAISLGGRIALKFRRGRNTKEKLGQRNKVDDLDISVNLDKKYSEQPLLDERYVQLQGGLIHLSGVGLTKGDADFAIDDLSSGERNYALAALALAFSVTDNTAILFDEPENSLHPKWQSSIVKDMWTIIASVSSRSKLLVATHSPLIVSGAANDTTYMMDLEEGENWIRSTMFGNTSDAVLREQFGLYSPRSMSFISLLQKCLRALITVHKDPNRFRRVADELLGMNVRLSPDDPLYLTYTDIEEARRALP